MQVMLETTQELLKAFLKLVDQRLELLEQDAPLSPAERESAFKLCTARENQYRARCEAVVDAGGAAPLEYLFRVFSLTDFERHCVSLSLAAELDSSYEMRYARLQSDGSRLPGLELCLRTFTGDAGARVELLGTWKRRREVLRCIFRTGWAAADYQGDLTVGLKLEQRIVDFVLDYTAPGERLAGKTTLYWPGDAEQGTLAPLLLRVDSLQKMLACLSPPMLFFLQGEEGAGRRTLARHLCRALERPLLEVEFSALLQEASWEDAVVSVCREAVLRGAYLGFRHFELLQDQEDQPSLPEGDAAGETSRQASRKPYVRLLLEHISRICPVVFFFSSVAWKPGESSEPYSRVELHLETPDIGQRISLWENCLREYPCAYDASLDTLATKFALNPGQIAAAAREAERLARWENAEYLNDEILHRACRAQLSHSLGKKASRVNASYTWEDLILPTEQKRQLQNACAQVEYRHQVYDRWGFGKKVAYGRGVSMLFSGPPGTGKTMAAQVIASRLRLELYKVDLSGVMSKYVGETEKQLGAVFEEVKKSQSILFFDEADALFGKRSETKDAHDRYANVQTSYLLQKIEEYDGIVILASNFLQNFDEAFKRRIKFIVEFTLPDRERREEIWRSVMPPELPRDEDIDFDFLSRSFELSGSSIKNIVVSAAFLAAGDHTTLGMVHLLLAVQAEQNKTGKTMGKDEFGEYYHQVQLYQKMISGQE